MSDRGFQPRALGEIAIRCADMGAMVAFYEDVIGLERLTGDHNSAITFFRIAEGFDGHTQILALFHHRAAPRSGLHPVGDEKPTTGAGSSLHHIALSLPFAEQQAVMRWYDTIGQSYRVEQFGWIGWRGIFTEDPEGNTVELVAYDPSMLDQA
ncbi:Glyoxalase-like domain protein [Ruegeria denitrificans]|uniref:Glyoxalase-like domain protein n=1 Tax=Ruegeria denitrificans TaxID=1715692 RepID=A0A0N7MA68_9RHOB|nr:VOC family protein [Ruegeria denitrificans]CUK08021.1 Glyoxalase-like domain protein [Ruegeria denitrificans]